jgi:CheY-like chemotaxis protein
MIAMKVLIVDDSEEVRRMIMHFIRHQVNEVIECADGSEALDAYKQHSPDLVLMDIKMKNVDGLAATIGIKTMFPGAYVVIVSQFDSPALRETARRAGASDYINKADLLPLRELLATYRAETI